ncbi:related to phosphoglycerate mutase family protein [Fusarium fujikuroi IMI 58289]|uniref:Related to phosphoglycerate mutase family protein n=1 Tax=Gibberella fujikuroi (strain CBS 195.34 / IMI 58289 / NRRL A-6831) TaxID=1279085 RepID=S0E3N0_GIBF5|nr:related to phosphoglycerate mutase family protein [Fusarium fujikuroi IMI 58289]CCT69439.1 related to phosphoglycerate mutase family protein [Fusarium fujikuroi IMI 58289]SCV51513.1 related to phosphoglycerate mutase family protein [Fusarium fujikuroi]
MSSETSTKPTIYMIRHGEKPAEVDGQEPDGLSAQGKKRADDLPNVFGENSSYNIGYIMAEHPHHDGSRDRPYKTVEPLADALGLKVHKRLKEMIMLELRAKLYPLMAIGIQGYAVQTGWTGEVKYPGDRFDLIWVVPPPYTEITVVGSELVPGLDDGVHVNANGDVPPPSAD